MCWISSPAAEKKKERKNKGTELWHCILWTSSHRSQQISVCKYIKSTKIPFRRVACLCLSEVLLVIMCPGCACAYRWPKMLIFSAMLQWVSQMQRLEFHTSLGGDWIATPTQIFLSQFTTDRLSFLCASLPFSLHTSSGSPLPFKGKMRILEWLISKVFRNGIFCLFYTSLE